MWCTLDLHTSSSSLSSMSENCKREARAHSRQRKIHNQNGQHSRDSRTLVTRRTSFVIVVVVVVVWVGISTPQILGQGTRQGQARRSQMYARYITLRIGGHNNNKNTHHITQPPSRQNKNLHYFESEYMLVCWYVMLRGKFRKYFHIASELIKQIYSSCFCLESDDDYFRHLTKSSISPDDINYRTSLVGATYDE